MKGQLVETEIGLMPREWQVGIIGTLVNFKTGKLNSNAAEPDGAYPFFTCSQETFRINAYAFNQKAVLLSGNNARAVYSVKYYNGKFNAYQRTYVITINNEEEYNYEFLKHVLSRQLEHLKSISIGSQTKYLTLGMLLNLKVPILPVNEQRKIALILDTIQKAIEQQDKLIRHTTELKKALMQKLFTEGTKGEKQKQTEIGLVPESWEVKSLIDAVEYIDYGVSQAIPKTPPKNGVKIVSTADINRAGDLLYYQIRTIEVPQRTAEKLKLNEGDLLFNWRNSPELIGKSTIFHEQDEPHIFASFILRIKCGEKKSHNYYMKYLMNHYREEGVFIKLARRAVNQANYNRNEISVLRIPVPPIDEQVEVARIITKVEDKVNHHKAKKEKLTEVFKTLLHELMTGERRVNEIEFEAITKEYEIKERLLSIAAE